MLYSLELHVNGTLTTITIYHYVIHDRIDSQLSDHKKMMSLMDYFQQEEFVRIKN